MKLRWILIALALATVATPALAGKKYGRQVRFAGVHPVPKGEGGGMCHIEGPHVHIYAANKLEYRLHDDDYVFVGDPVAYGWDGPKYAYKGNHPVHVEERGSRVPAGGRTGGRAARFGEPAGRQRRWSCHGGGGASVPTPRWRALKPAHRTVPVERGPEEPEPRKRG